MYQQGQRVFFHVYMSIRVMEGAVEKEANKEPKIFIGPREIGEGDDHTCLSRKETTSVDSQ